MYTQTAEAIKTFQNVDSTDTTSQPASDTFSAIDKDFDISSTIQDVEQLAMNVSVKIEDTLGEPVTKIKETVGAVKDNIDNLATNVVQTIGLEDSIKTDSVNATVHETQDLGKHGAVDHMKLNQVDFDTVGDIGLAGPKVTVSEKVVDSFIAESKQPKQPKIQPKSQILSNFKPQVIII